MLLSSTTFSALKTLLQNKYFQHKYFQLVILKTLFPSFLAATSTHCFKNIDQGNTQTKKIIKEKLFINKPCSHRRPLGARDRQRRDRRDRGGSSPAANGGFF